MLNRRTLFVSIAAVSALCGCYEYVPSDASALPPLGERYSFEISDRGRVSLSDRMGSGVMSVEGILAERDSDAYVVSVRRVNQINGDYALWSGETVRIPQDAVADVLRRKLSRPKTYLAAGSAVAGLGLFVASHGIFNTGGSAEDDSNPPPPPDGTSSRVWR